MTLKPLLILSILNLMHVHTGNKKKIMKIMRCCRENDPPVAEFPCLLKYVMRFCSYTHCPLEGTTEPTKVIVFTYRHQTLTSFLCLSCIHSKSQQN